MDESPGPTEHSLFDLTGMTPSDARDYVVSLVAHLKQVESEWTAADNEVQKWESRGLLAEQTGQVDLKDQAEAQRSGAVDKRNRLAVEVKEFQAGVASMKKQLHLLPLTQRTVNTDALMDNLANLAGPLDELAPMVKRAEADEALAALKKRLAEKP